MQCQAGMVKCRNMSPEPSFLPEVDVPVLSWGMPPAKPLCTDQQHLCFWEEKHNAFLSRCSTEPFRVALTVERGPRAREGRQAILGSMKTPHRVSGA